MHKFNQQQTTQKTSFYADHSTSIRMGEPEKLFVPDLPPKILLIDDDPTFSKIMSKAAARSGVTMGSCQSVEDIDSVDPGTYQVHIIDYDLGYVNGLEFVRYLESFSLGEIPVILVSHSNLPGKIRWPDSIREFVHKNLGPFAILDAAFEAFEVMVIHQKMAKNRFNRHD